MRENVIYEVVSFVKCVNKLIKCVIKCVILYFVYNGPQTLHLHSTQVPLMRQMTRMPKIYF